MNNYRERIYDMARQIPYGRVMTYGQIAELLDGNERYTAQTVGWAMHALGDTGPWARVINAKGGCSTGKVMLPGNKQQFILESEGIVFDAQGYCDLQKYLFIPVVPVVLINSEHAAMLTEQAERDADFSDLDNPEMAQEIADVIRMENHLDPGVVLDIAIDYIAGCIAQALHANGYKKSSVAGKPD